MAVFTENQGFGKFELVEDIDEKVKHRTNRWWLYLFSQIKSL